jgi:hypothetical protein
MTEHERYREAWRSVSLRRAITTALWVGIVPIGMIMIWGFHLKPVWVVFLYGPIYLGSVIWLNRFSCPRCDKQFFSRNKFPKTKCVSCGLQIGDMPETIRTT